MIGRFSGVVKATGEPVSWRFVDVWEIDEGVAVRFEAFLDTLTAERAYGLESCGAAVTQARAVARLQRELLAQAGDCIAVVGTFDGVHRGHRAVLDAGKNWALAEGWRADRRNAVAARRGAVRAGHSAAVHLHGRRTMRPVAGGRC